MIVHKLSLKNTVALLTFEVLFGLSSAAVADSGGINSVTGSDLPLGAGGQEIMRLGAGQDVPVGVTSFNGAVGIGTRTPQTALDVHGSVNLAASGASVGSTCSPEGAMAYDQSAHTPVYCNNSGVWTRIGGSCSWYNAGPGYLSASISCPAGTTAMSGGCNSGCAWLYKNYISDNTQICLAMVTHSLCFDPWQGEITAYILCCQ